LFNLWASNCDDAIREFYLLKCEEHSTSIYSGIVQLLDLALGFEESGTRPLGLFLVAPDKRSEEVRAQLRRPAFSKVQETKFFFVSYGELQKNFEAMGKFGQGVKAIEAITERLTP
jgi:type II restriction enzyme